jgi:hypothetical protein
VSSSPQVCGTGWFSKAEPRDPSRFAYTRVFCTPDNESHFETVTVALSKTNAAPPASPLYAGGNRPVSTALFVGADAQWGTHDLQNRLNHPAPATQFVVVLAGTFSVTTTDGDTRRFSPGDAPRAANVRTSVATPSLLAAMVNSGRPLPRHGPRRQPGAPATPHRCRQTGVLCAGPCPSQGEDTVSMREWPRDADVIVIE